MIICAVGCSLCLEICEILSWLLSPSHNKWYQSIQVPLGISEDSEGSRSDSVEIVCRSQIRGIGVRGIVCRSQEDARRARGICVGVDQE